MKDDIFLISEAGDLQPLKRMNYTSEDVLQSLVERFPEILAGAQIDPESPRRWLLVKREQGIEDSDGGKSRWALDHLFLDQDGVPTLVEIKRSTDTRIRREVIGQVLDYAANVARWWRAETIQQSFESTCSTEGKDAAEVLDRFLCGESPENFWQMVKTNLQAGHLRILIAADEIPSELAAIVEFLNRQMDPVEFLALELPQFEGNGLRTLVPKLIGRTSEAESRKSSGRKPSEKQSIEEVWEYFREHQSPAQYACSERLAEWQRLRTGQLIPTTNGFMAKFPKKDRTQAFFKLEGNGGIFFNLAHMRNKPPFSDLELRRTLLRKLADATGLPLTELNPDGYPAITGDNLLKPGVLERLIPVFDWVWETINAYSDLEA